MKKYIFLLGAFLSSIVAFSQVGIDTQEPKATLDVVANPSDLTKPDGLIAPRLTGEQLKNKDALYTETTSTVAGQTGTIVYVTEALDSGETTAKTGNVTSVGYYYFDGTVWQKINGSGTNIYKDNGTLTANRTVAMEDKTLSFTSTATAGTSHFQVDGSTLNIDAVKNNVGIGTTSPSAKLEINNGTTAGALKIVDGTQGEGKFLVSDASGVATWRESTGTALVINSATGNIVDLTGTLKYIGASATVAQSGYYIVSPQVITDKNATGCSLFIAYNLSKSSASLVSAAFPGQDVHMPSSAGLYDFIYTSNIAYLTAGTYYMLVRYGGNCGTHRTRNTSGQNGFILTLLK